MYKNIESVIRKTKTTEEWLNKVKKVKEFNVLDSEGHSILGISAYYGHINACQYIINRGGNINQKDRFGNTALQSAIEASICNLPNKQSYHQVIRFLIEQGADVNNFDKQGISVLMEALRGHHHQEGATHDRGTILLLLENGANIHHKDIWHMTPLFYAVSYGDSNIVRKILESGADIHHQDANGRNALYFAAESANQDFGTEDERRLIHQEYTKIIKLLLERGASLYACSKIEQDNLLIVAAGKGHNQLVSYCLKNGIPINHQDAVGNTALMKASRMGHAAIVNRLLIDGADADLRDSTGHTAMWYAHKYKQRQIEEIFSKYNIPIVHHPVILDEAGKFDKYERTLLMLACKAQGSESVERVALLLKSGAEVNKQDKYNKTALLHLLDSNFYGNVIQQKFDLLLNVPDIDINKQSKAGMTALMYACKAGDEHFVRALINKGANAHLQTKKGEKALSFVKSYNTPLKELLLSCTNKEQNV